MVVSEPYRGELVSLEPLTAADADEILAQVTTPERAQVLDLDAAPTSALIAEALTSPYDAAFVWRVVVGSERRGHVGVVTGPNVQNVFWWVDPPEDWDALGEALRYCMRFYFAKARPKVEVLYIYVPTERYEELETTLTDLGFDDADGRLIDAQVPDTLRVMAIERTTFNAYYLEE